MNMINKKEEAATLENPAVNEGVRLKSLTLSEGTIRFEPDVAEYDITVDAGVSKILVKGITYDEDSFYTVSGNSNMKSGYNDIVITVTDKEGNTGHYYIHVLVGEKQTEEKQTGQEETAQALISDTAPPADKEAFEGLEKLLQSGLDELDSFVEAVTADRFQYVTYGVLCCGALALFLWILVFFRRLAAKRRYKKARRERLAHREERQKQWELAEQQQDLLLKQVDELLDRKKKSRGPVSLEEPLEAWEDDDPEDAAFEDAFEDVDEYDEYDDYDENEAELDRWLAGLDERDQDEDR